MGRVFELDEFQIGRTRGDRADLLSVADRYMWRPQRLPVMIDTHERQSNIDHRR